MRRSRVEFTPMVGVLPESSKGVAQIKHYEVTEAEASFSRVRFLATRGREQPVKEGKYAQLLVHGQLMMSDTQMEQDSNADLIQRARGNVLIAGLGLGMVLVPLLKKPNVDTILVIEKYQDVIDLVSPHFKEAIEEDRLVILCEDIFKWTPPDDWEFDTIYFDIWPTISGDNYKQMERLHNGFKFNLATGGWMESWLRGECAEYAGHTVTETAFGVEIEPEEDDEEYGGVEFDPEEEDDE